MSSMETERKTPLKSERLPASNAGFNLAAFLAGRDRLARLSLIVALAALMVTVFALMQAFANSRQKTLFVVLDPSGNTIVAPGVLFIEAKELHVQQAILATAALLLRNPKDFDQPEILQALYSKNALAQATALKTAEAAEFVDRQLHQKPQITRSEAISTRQEEVQIQVKGQIARWGVVQEAPFSDALAFTLRLVFQPNGDLLRNRRQPVIVTQFTLKYEKPEKPRS